MALPSSGQISLLEIGTEFSDTSPYSISEYVGEVGKTATAGQNVAFSDFYGLSSGHNLTTTLIYTLKENVTYGFMRTDHHTAGPWTPGGSISEDTINGYQIDGVWMGGDTDDDPNHTIEVVLLGAGRPLGAFTSIEVNGITYNTSTADIHANTGDGLATRWYWSWSSHSIPTGWSESSNHTVIFT